MSLRTTDLNDEGEIIGEGIYLDKENVPENYLLKKGDLFYFHEVALSVEHIFIKLMNQ